MIRFLSQVGSITRFGLLGIPQRRGSVIAAIFGVGGVVAVLIGVLSMASGFRKVMAASGSPDSVIVLRAGADSEMVSGFRNESTRVITDGAGIAQGTNGPLASAELFVVINLPKRSTGTDANVPLRGVGPAALQVRGQLMLKQGRMFDWGKNEVVVGMGAAREFAGLEVGKKIIVARNEWIITGIFSANGGMAESEIWTDATVLQGAYNRGNTYQSVYAKLVTPEAYFPFSNSLATDPRLNVKVLRQNEYYAEQSTVMTKLITTLGYLVASLMAIGAIFGALNTMYTAVSSRTREVATLRALGFGSAPVIVSIMLESLLLSLAGGVIGASLAYAAFHKFHTATMNFQSFSQVTFAFDVTFELLIQGIVWAILIGFVGGLFPALRAARLPIAAALREL